MSAEPVLPRSSAGSPLGGAYALKANAARCLAPLKVGAGSLILAIAWVVTLPASAAQSPATPLVVAMKPAAGPAAYAKGEIKKIDTERGVIRLKHGPIKHMGMPDMTMSFHLAHPDQIADFKVGDRVQFRVEKIAGTLVIVELIAFR